MVQLKADPAKSPSDGEDKDDASESTHVESCRQQSESNTCDPLPVELEKPAMGL